MSAESHSNITELRFAAKEAKRFHDQKHKWAYGDRPLAGLRLEEGTAPDKTRPIKPLSKGATNQFHKWNEHNINKMAAGNRKALRDDVASEIMNPSDSSADEDIREASAAPEPDAGIAYSYDASRGPGQGSQILSLALAQAVEKFETKETEKLVKNEYEVVGKESESADGYTADDDDFELI